MMKKLLAISLCIAIALSACACTAKQKKASGYSEVYAAVKKYQSENRSNARYILNDGADAALAVTSEEYSKTNAQVDGIDEADTIKTDGKYVYYLDSKNVTIYEAAGENSRKVGCVTPPEESGWVSRIYVSDGVLMLIASVNSVYGGDAVSYEDGRERTMVYYYDVSDPASAKLIASSGQDGWLMTSRLFDGKLYLLTSYYIMSDAVRTEPETYVPQLYCNGEAKLADSQCISIMPCVNEASYVVTGAYDAKTGNALTQRSVLGAGSTAYMNENSLYLAAWRLEQEELKAYTESIYNVSEHADKQYTDIMRINVSDLSVAATGTVEGYLDSQFSMDEYNGALRVVTTNEPNYWTVYRDEARDLESYKYDTERSSPANNLYILDDSLNKLSSVEGLAKGERVYSVRFDGDFVYFCTFRQVDPLFAADVSDTKNPKILSELKISGFSDYLHTWSDDRLFGLGNEADEETGVATGLKLVMFDTSDKANVTVKNTKNLAGSSYTEALYDHTALLISPERNIIGFCTGTSYLLFSYSDENGFIQTVEIPLDEELSQARAVYVGDSVYVADMSGMKVLSLDAGKVIASVDS